jgi:anti-anti-sigma regulatory factor
MIDDSLSGVPRPGRRHDPHAPHDSHVFLVTPERVPAHGIVVLQGDVNGASLGDLASVLDEPALGAVEKVAVDVSGVTSWTTTAQWLLLSTAHRLRLRGAQMVLYSPSDDLQHQSRHTRVFGRVETRDGSPFGEGPN